MHEKHSFFFAFSEMAIFVSKQQNKLLFGTHKSRTGFSCDNLNSVLTATTVPYIYRNVHHGVYRWAEAGEKTRKNAGYGRQTIYTGLIKYISLKSATLS